MEPERKLKNNDGVYITQVLQTDRQAYLKKETEKKKKRSERRRDERKIYAIESM